MVGQDGSHRIDATGYFLVYYREELLTPRGRLAQLGERHVRNVEVEGSNPLPSTISFLSCLWVISRELLLKRAKNVPKT
jgi:hypothetical protein